ncbi:cytochrome c [Candidatus Methylacidiphilum infernorum]|uniref:Cytochrome c n=1 Tax=Candidatus Methylacidiphilum infernorum TaxID=511746 RepID=A0ABX7PV94_9BACT|nr:cytochrome c [Candidatus Methylacidiphilum infernorum]QSR86501.1 cytochrome c [Candidatus Methylacidiphilum infernorum]
MSFFPRFNSMLSSFFLIFFLSTAFARASGELSSNEPIEIGESGLYTLDSSGLIFPFIPYPQDSSAVYSVGAYPLTTEPLPLGERQEIVQSYCSMCHSTTVISLQPKFSGQTWRHEVEKMKKLGAQIPDDLIVQIIGYLEKNCSVNPERK